jgi:hypothetical protein
MLFESFLWCRVALPGAAAVECRRSRAVCQGSRCDAKPARLRLRGPLGVASAGTTSAGLRRPAAPPATRGGRGTAAPRQGRAVWHPIEPALSAHRPPAGLPQPPGHPCHGMPTPPDHPCQEAMPEICLQNSTFRHAASQVREQLRHLSLEARAEATEDGKRAVELRRSSKVGAPRIGACRSEQGPGGMPGATRCAIGCRARGGRGAPHRGRLHGRPGGRRGGGRRTLHPAGPAHHWHGTDMCGRPMPSGAKLASRPPRPPFLHFTLA